MDKVNDLKNLIQRLNDGENLENVRKDFVEKFSGVSSEEIAAAEQKLIDEGTPVEEVQKVCGVHAALFQGHAENNSEIDIETVEVGHPSKTLHDENIALEKFLDELEEKISANKVEDFCKQFPKLNAIHAHYGKKEFLFMPVLSKYGVTGPSQVMWGVDDEIKAQVRTLAKTLTPENFSDKLEKIQATLNEVRDMISREENIFIPLTFRFFTEEDFLNIYRDSLEMQAAFIEKIPRWTFGDEKIAKKITPPTFSAEKIKLPTGELTLAQLNGILKLLPVDITFIDKNDTVKFFVNEGKIFDRPLLALDNDIYSCHPPQIIPVVKKMLADFKEHKRASMEVWRKIKGKPTSVGYFAVYDDDGEYIGAVEFVREYSDALKKFA